MLLYMVLALQPHCRKYIQMGVGHTSATRLSRDSDYTVIAKIIGYSL